MALKIDDERKRGRGRPPGFDRATALRGVHGHQRDDLHDVRIRVAGIADGFQIGVTDLAAGLVTL